MTYLLRLSIIVLAMISWPVLADDDSNRVSLNMRWHDVEFWRSATPQDIQAGLAQGIIDLDARSENGWSPLDFAASYNTNPEVVAALVQAGADVSARYENGLSPLHVAASYNT